MAVCLLPEKIDAFKQALKSKELKLSDLLDPSMTSEARTAIFKEYAGENAADVNRLFEQKLVLKNQMLGITNMFSKLTESRKYSPRRIADAQASLSEFRASQQERILTPAETETFLNTMADKLTGTHVTKEMAANVFDLSQKMDEAKASIDPTEPNGSQSRLDYGAAKVIRDNYVNGIKRDIEKIGSLQDMKEHPVQTAIKIAAVAKEAKSTGDISSILRQGMKIIFSHPGIWLKDSLAAFSDVARQITVKGTNTDVRDAIQADIVSRKNAIDGTYKKMGLDINTDEELYPSQAVESVPILGRVTAATRAGYEGFLHRARADLADKYLDMAQKSGVDMKDPKQLESIGKMVNALTGRGYISSDSPLTSAAFWSPRMIKSNVDFLTAHQAQRGVTSFVRKQAAINLIKTISGVAGVLALAKAVNSKSVNFDSRSTDFGKIKVGKIAFDVSGGSGTLLVLASRLIQNSTVSSAGKVENLNTGKFGSQTSGDVIWNFLTGKASPSASVALDLANRHMFGGAPINLETEAVNAVAPFPIENIMSATPDVGLANAIGAELLDALGAYETLPYTPPKKK